MSDSASQKISSGSKKGSPSEAAGPNSSSSSSGVSNGEKAPENPVRPWTKLGRLHSFRRAPQRWQSRQMQKVDDHTTTGTATVEDEILQTSDRERQSLQRGNLSNSVRAPGKEAWVGISPPGGTPDVSTGKLSSHDDALVAEDSTDDAEHRDMERTDCLREEDELEATVEPPRGRRRGV